MFHVVDSGRRRKAASVYADTFGVKCRCNRMYVSVFAQCILNLNVDESATWRQSVRRLFAIATGPGGAPRAACKNCRRSSG